MVRMYQGWVAWIWFEVYILANLIHKQRLKCMQLGYRIKDFCRELRRMDTFRAINFSPVKQDK